VQGADPSEGRVLQALRSGDEEAFAALLNRHGPSMIRVACLYVGSRAVAEEVVQETWIDMIGGLDNFEERSSLRTWIFVILVNNARKRAEREARSIALSQLERELGEAAPEDALFFSPDHPRWPGAWTTAVRRWDALPHEVLVSRETFDVVLRAAEDLPPLQRAVLTLRDVEGLAAADVCSMLEISEANERVLLHRARGRVRVVLEEYLERNL
jgi:RNA polymerase sigma-70 factor, ECF subfamily